MPDLTTSREIKVVKTLAGSRPEIGTWLCAMRRRFLKLIGPMSLEVWSTLREPDYAAAPAWIVFRLVEHQAGHTFQIREMKRRWQLANNA
jgi:hypothetical protein